LTRRQWKDHEAERKRIAQAWLTFRSEQEKLQSATNAHVATRTAKVHAAAASAVEATTKVANERVMETKTTASGLVRRWKSHAAALNSVIEDHEAVIAEQAERLLELEALLREHGLPPGPTM
jgi:PIN domain nuclease of toxin-antitoxin system